MALTLTPVLCAMILKPHTHAHTSHAPGASTRNRLRVILLAVIGGSKVYGAFLDIGFDCFHLSRVPDVRLPGGRPVFPEVGPNRSPEDVLRSHGLKPGAPHVFDAARNVTMVTWSR